MKKEEKDLLLKDLCGRLTYGVKVKFGDSKPALLTVIERDEFGWQIGSEDEFGGMITIIDNVKPYLFPMSSMTKEQKEEFNTQSLKLQLQVIDEEIMYEKATEFEVDFYNKHHLDWRGLIPKGLAIDATGLNIY